MIANIQMKQSDTEATLEKLNRIEGRIRGLVKMLQEQRDPRDVLMQISATHEALRMVSKAVMKTYLQNSVATGLNAINPERKEDAYAQVLDTIYTYAK